MTRTDAAETATRPKGWHRLVAPLRPVARGVNELGRRYIWTPDVTDYGSRYLARVRGGDMGAIPAVLGLIALCVVFSMAHSSFLTTDNFANLLNQGAGWSLIAMGLVFVLLVNEIDLSAGFTSGVCAAVMAVLLEDHDVGWYLSIPAAILTGAVIGLMLGFLVAKIGIPSFVVTLAAFLAFQGVLLLLIDEGRNITINDSLIRSISGEYMPIWLGWTMVGVTVGGYGLVQLRRWHRRSDSNLNRDPLQIVVLRIIALAAILGAGVYFLSQERSNNPALISLKGVPWVVLIVGGLLVVWTFVLRRTAYGRHLYAVGGNREAARRAGINVDRIRMSAFLICSSMAAVGGIVLASRANSVDPNTGGSNTLLLSVGAAVIGGASLFGGRGTVKAAVLGGAVVATIYNGMGLVGFTSGQRFVVTGSVLLLAAGVDALSRRRAQDTGTR